jgi:hypothetical protein
MKRLFLLLAAVSVLALGCSEADTIYPGDESFNNPSVPVGTEITSLTATVSTDATVTNPVIRIDFDTPVDDASISYGGAGTIQVESPPGTPLTIGTQFDPYPNPLTSETGIVIIDLNDFAPLSGTVIRIILTSGLNAYTNPLIPLTNPGNFDVTILP